MRSPEGQDYENIGCLLELFQDRRLVFTDLMGADYRPLPPRADASCHLGFTAVVSFEPAPGGTRYTARAMHKDEADRNNHEAMGFHDGWGLCLDQLVEVANSL